MFRSILFAAIVAISTQATHLKGREDSPPPIMGTDSGTICSGCDGHGIPNKNLNFNTFP